jgi:hypothetical protein
MNPEQVFSIVNMSVLPGWLLLVVAPRWKWTRRLVPVVMAMPLAVVYVVLLAGNFGGEGGFGSLEGVATLFRNPWVLLGGWIHYLVFDLFVGAWEVRDAQRLGLPHGAVIPCLLLTFMLGPAGLLLYWILRSALRKRWTLEETA